MTAEHQNPTSVVKMKQTYNSLFVNCYALQETMFSKCFFYNRLVTFTIYVPNCKEKFTNN